MVNHKGNVLKLFRSIMQQFIKFYCPNQRGTCMFSFGSEFASNSKNLLLPYYCKPKI